MGNKLKINSFEDYVNALDDLWETSLGKNINTEILKRGYAIPERINKADLLIVGINPSYGNLDDINGNIFKHTFPCLDMLKKSKDTYWKELCKIIPDNISCEHIDIFTLREARQTNIREIGLHSNPGLDFLVKHIWITQQMIENVIKPKLIVVANRAAGAYFGKFERYTWIGYKLKPHKIKGIETVNSPKEEEGELCFVSGFKDDAISRSFLSPEEFNKRYSELPSMKILFGCMQSPRGIPLNNNDKRRIKSSTIQAILNSL